MRISDWSSDVCSSDLNDIPSDAIWPTAPLNMKDGRALTEKSAKPNGSSGRLTGSAPSPHLKNRPLRREAGLAGGLPHAVAELLVIDVRRVTALNADQENTVVQTFRMGVADVGVGTSPPPRPIESTETVHEPRGAVRRPHGET